jgi:acyl-CoA reductase-like NAD-dependent aldehyde dehydrogenase
MGALCLPDHTDRLQELVDEAKSKGAEIAVRGKHFIRQHLGHELGGQFYPPTVILNVNHSMKLMQEEV